MHLKKKDLGMGDRDGSITFNLMKNVSQFLRICLFSVLSFGPMPRHIAFIMDGNRRYAKRRAVKHGAGHTTGFTALTTLLKYCYEMGVKYVTVYAFSIDNFKRDKEEVHSLMNLIMEKIYELLKEESIVSRLSFKIYFWGNLNLLSEPVRLAAEKAMAATAKNTGPVLSVCVAYTSTYEIMRAVEVAHAQKKDRIVEGFHNECNGDASMKVNIDGSITVADVEQNLYTVDCPDPDIVIRTSGETRLSNFLLWQTTLSHLQNPASLWPEFSLRQLVWAILEYQKVYHYIEGMRSRSKKED